MRNCESLCLADEISFEQQNIPIIRFQEIELFTRKERKREAYETTCSIVQ